MIKENLKNKTACKMQGPHEQEMKKNRHRNSWQFPLGKNWGKDQEINLTQELKERIQSI